MSLCVENNDRQQRQAQSTLNIISPEAKFLILRVVNKLSWNCSNEIATTWNRSNAILDATKRPLSEKPLRAYQKTGFGVYGWILLWIPGHVLHGHTHGFPMKAKWRKEWRGGG